MVYRTLRLELKRRIPRRPRYFEWCCLMNRGRDPGYVGLGKGIRWDII
jgi:hypothetical protein